MNEARTPDPPRAEYRRRIHRVVDHIEANLERDLSLEELARVANFSPWHFHRLFGAIAGETLFRFIQRLRVEKAARLLRESRSRSVTEIALACGFSGPAVFARAFRAAFDCTAGQWRDANAHGLDGQDRKAGQASGNQSKARPAVVGQIEDVRFNQERNPPMKTVEARSIEVVDQPARSLAYVRHVGPYKGDGALFEGLIGRLMRWAGPRGLVGPEAELIAVYHDDPAITDEAKLRTSMCLSVPAQTAEEGEVGRMELPGGRCVVAEFELADDEYEAAWQAVYGGWLPESGWQPDDRPCFERYLRSPDQHPEGKCHVQICVPVKPL